MLQDNFPRQLSFLALRESCVKVRLLVDDLKWSNASLYTYLCMMRITPRSAPRCAKKQKNRQRLCHSEPISGQKSGLCWSRIPTSALWLKPPWWTSWRAGGCRFWKPTWPTKPGGWTRTKHLCSVTTRRGLLILSLPSTCIQMCALL